MQQCRALKCIIHVHCRTAYLGAPDRAVDRGQLAGLDRVQHVQGYGVHSNILSLQLEYFCHKGWGQNAKLGPHSAVWGKLGTALQAYALNPCTKFPPNPTSRKVNT